MRKKHSIGVVARIPCTILPSVECSYCRIKMPEKGKKGARIDTVSTEVIENSMGLKAAKEYTERIEVIKKATLLRRTFTPEEVAEAARLLISNAARFISGADILVYGGDLENKKQSS